MKTLLTMFCMACALLLNAQSLKQAEYFFDKDKGVGLNTKLNIAVAPDSSYALNIVTTSLKPGMHKLYIRMKDSNGKWSIINSSNVEVLTANVETVIMGGEYFFDKDPGFGKGKQVAVDNNDTLIVKSFIATTASLAAGYHKLYTRFKDNYGKWSSTNSQSIEVIKTPDTVHVIAVEYLFKNDKGFGKTTVKTFATISQDSTFKFKILYSEIPAGADSLFVRVKDDNGKWSTTKIAAFSIQKLLGQNAATANVFIEDDDQLKVYPNPARDFINISFQSKKESVVIQIFAENGKQVFQGIIKPGFANKISVNKLAAGTYFIKIIDGETSQSAAFIKQ